MLRLVVQPQHLIMCQLASSAQIIQDPTADFKVTASGQSVSSCSGGGESVHGSERRPEIGGRCPRWNRPRHSLCVTER